MRYVCSRCHKTLKQLEMFSGAQVVGSMPRLYDGVVCDRRGHVECTTCKASRPASHVDSPCSWCGSPVSPAYERASGSVKTDRLSRAEVPAVAQTASRRYEPPTEEEERAARAKAEQAAALRRDREVEEDIRSLTHTDPKVRLAAADKLGEAQEVRALNALLHVLIQDVEPGCRAVAAWALGKLGKPAAVEALNRSAIEDPDERVRREASAALNRIKETRSTRSTSEAPEHRQHSERKRWQFWK